jgi:hypothetical protein
MGGIVERLATSWSMRSSHPCWRLGRLLIVRRAARLGVGSGSAWRRSLGPGRGDRAAVDIADLVGGVVAQAGDDPGAQHGGDGAQRPGVWWRPVWHLSRWSRAARVGRSCGVVGGQEQRLAQAGVAVVGRAADRVGEARGVLVGMSPEKDRAAARLVNRWGRRAGRGSGRRGACRHRGRKAGCGRVGVAVVVEDPLIEAGDLA